MKAKKEKIHFIGIGGIGISALAKYYLSHNNIISGSDINESPIIEELRKKGATISIGPHKSKNLPDDTDRVIYTPAISLKNPEIKKAKKLNCLIQSYPQALGELTKKHFTIAVAGTHGKSTTTALIGLILEKANYDPLVIVGTKVKEWGNSNIRLNKEKKGKNILVIEADEWQASFLNYWPDIIVLTNIEEEHLDYYKNLKEILETFKSFINHLPHQGILIANLDDHNIKYLIKNITLKKIYGYKYRDKLVAELKKYMQIPGRHNIYNALAASKTAQIMGIEKDIIFKVLKKFHGVWRRLEEHIVYLNKKYSKKIIVFYDYAHHPTEIKAGIQAVKEKYPNKKIWIVFQPHQYSRTFKLFKKFTTVFDKAEKIIILPIFSVVGREDKNIMKKINAQMLVQAIQKRKKFCQFIPSIQKAKTYLLKNLSSDDIVLIMGAGDIWKLRF